MYLIITIFPTHIGRESGDIGKHESSRGNPATGTDAHVDLMHCTITSDMIAIHVSHSFFKGERGGLHGKGKGNGKRVSNKRKM